MQVPLLAERADPDVAVLSVQEQRLINVLGRALQLFPVPARAGKAKGKQEEKNLRTESVSGIHSFRHRYRNLLWNVRAL